MNREMGSQPIRMQLRKMLQEKSCRKFLLENLAGKSCGKFLVGKSCRKILQEIFAGKTCRKFLWENLVILLYCYIGKIMPTCIE